MPEVREILSVVTFYAGRMERGWEHKANLASVEITATGLLPQRMRLGTKNIIVTNPETCFRNRSHQERARIKFSC